MADPEDMLDCRAALNNLQDYLKREITAELAVEIKQHLERCRPCLNHARFEENFLQMLATRAGRVSCPDVLRARILAALRTAADEV
jgi:anti-sigma factor (TIGR02949 family)